MKPHNIAIILRPQRDGQVQTTTVRWYEGNPMPPLDDDTGRLDFSKSAAAAHLIKIAGEVREDERPRFRRPLTPEQLQKGFAEVERNDVGVSMICMNPVLLAEVVEHGSDTVEIDPTNKASLWNARLVATSGLKGDEVVFVSETGSPERFEVDANA
jgi:hypothetical protein